MPTYYSFSDGCVNPHIASNPNTQVISARSTISPNCAVQEVSPLLAGELVLDQELTAAVFAGVVTLWLAGMGIGFILSMLKKFKL